MKKTLKYATFKDTSKFYSSGEFEVEIPDELLKLEGEERSKLFYEMQYHILPKVVSPETTREFGKCFYVVISDDEDHDIIGYPYMRKPLCEHCDNAIANGFACSF